MCSLNRTLNSIIIVMNGSFKMLLLLFLLKESMGKLVAEKIKQFQGSNEQSQNSISRKKDPFSNSVRGDKRNTQTKNSGKPIKLGNAEVLNPQDQKNKNKFGDQNQRNMAKTRQQNEFTTKPVIMTRTTQSSSLSKGVFNKVKTPQLNLMLSASSKRNHHHNHHSSKTTKEEQIQAFVAQKMNTSDFVSCLKTLSSYILMSLCTVSDFVEQFMQNKTQALNLKQNITQQRLLTTSICTVCQRSPDLTQLQKKFLQFLQNQFSSALMKIQTVISQGMMDKQALAILLRYALAAVTKVLVEMQSYYGIMKKLFASVSQFGYSLCNLFQHSLQVLIALLNIMAKKLIKSKLDVITTAASKLKVRTLQTRYGKYLTQLKRSNLTVVQMEDLFKFHQVFTAKFNSLLQIS